MPIFLNNVKIIWKTRRCASCKILEKGESLSDWLTDNLKSRDASASKKTMMASWANYLSTSSFNQKVKYCVGILIHHDYTRLGSIKGCLWYCLLFGRSTILMAITRPINHYYEDAEAGQDLHSPFLAAGQKHSLAKPPPNVQSC